MAGNKAWSGRLNAVIMLAIGFCVAPSTPSAAAIPPLQGTFIQLGVDQHWTETRLRELFRDFQALRLQRIVVQWTVVGNRAMYRSSTFESMPEPPLETILTLSDEFGFVVRVGLAHDPEFWNKVDVSRATDVERYLDGLRRRSLTAARELVPLVSQHRSFEGWFLPEEIDDVNWLAPERRVLLRAHLGDLGERLHTLTPSVTVGISGFSNAHCDPKTLGRFWRELLDGTRIDLVLFQDGIGTHKLELPYAALYLQEMKRATMTLGRALSVVVELFDQVGGPPIGVGEFSAVPTGIERLAQRLRLASDASTAGAVAFSVPNYMVPGAGTRALQLFTDYVKRFIDPSGPGGQGARSSPAVEMAGCQVDLPPHGMVYHGVYPGSPDGEEDSIAVADVLSYESAVGRRAAWIYFSHNWYHGRAFPLETATRIRGQGSIPFIRLMLRSGPDQNRVEPLYTLKAIVDRTFDADLIAWGDAARNFGSPLIVEWGTEVNGRWFSWNGIWNGGARIGPARFRDAFRHIVTTVRQRGATNITWMFHVNSADDPQVDWNRFERYYPGDDVVDWLGVSVYGAQTPLETDWTTFREPLDAVVSRFKQMAPGKPIFVVEFGATSGNPLGDPARWADAALTDLLAPPPRWPEVKGFSWWNETWQNDDEKKHDSDMRVQTVSGLAAVFRSHLGEGRIVERPLIACAAAR